APVGRIATLTVTVDRHEKPHNRRSPYRVRCHDDTGSLTLVFFHARDDYLRRLLPEGEVRVISGAIEDFKGEKQITHPDHVVRVEDKADIQVVEPVYPMTAGLSPKTLVRAIREALTGLPELPEWLDPAFLKQQRWSRWAEALRGAHSPETLADLEPDAPARQRLAYDELLANQLALVLVRARLRKSKGQIVTGDGSLRRKLAESLPYELTGAQKRSVEEITGDMGQPLRMLRLLQGDVGSGKTVTALMAMLAAVEAGGQAALLAPTEILARQHFDTLSELLAPLDIPIAILTGRDKGKSRKETLAGLQDGSIPLIVGTHALFQEEVAYHDLKLAVIDEQHRFGVHQRLMLAAKGKGPVDVLVMTATPIPRTLTLTAYGDMDVSSLDEKPPGRQPIDTRAVPNTRIEDVVGAVGRAIGQGRQVYWVCPLVEESDVLDVSAAEARYQSLREQFGDKVGLVHGQMKAEARDKAMQAFIAGDIRVLVATTVIEVGVDVPNATIMVIEHAERFGLAQLHQLRGRVGRG
ncbi:MAG: ATP-dependent DNA helicase RecG, partial [Alphaproteobacteria bacterium]|nr:ATP-dependent DNA helicase RecG [Alphaproteobacteria bacterium]